jgi:hypothetical protein
MSSEDIAEILRPHQPKARNYWLVLFLGVGPVWSITPLSWAYVTAVLWSGTLKSLAWTKLFWFILALAEVRVSSVIIPSLRPRLITSDIKGGF